MEAKLSHTIETVNFALSFSPDDFAKAFYNQADPDEILYYNLQTPGILKLTVPEQMQLLLKFAILVIGEPAANMEFEGGAVTNK